MVAVWLLIACLLIYPIAMRMIAHAVQPKRLVMARLAQRICREQAVPEHEKILVQRMLADSFNAKVAIGFCFIFPVVVITAIFRPNLVRSSSDEAPHMVELDEFARLHMISMAAANPAFSAILLLEVALLGPMIASILLFSGSRSRVDVLGIRHASMRKLESWFKQTRLTNSVC